MNGANGRTSKPFLGFRNILISNTLTIMKRFSLAPFAVPVAVSCGKDANNVNTKVMNIREMFFDNFTFCE